MRASNPAMGQGAQRYVTIDRVVTHPTGSSGRRLDIQGLRAVAVLMVVAYHAGLPIPGGFIGVDVFFVISGFVITGMLSREWKASGKIRFGHFYLRRFLRLTPALALMVTTTMLASATVLSPLGVQQAAAKTAAGAMLLSANYVIADSTGGYFDAPAEINPLLNTWSLSVEEQFYLAFPAILAFAWALAKGRSNLRRAPVFAVSLVLVGSAALALIGTMASPWGSNGWWLGFYSPLTRAWEFAAGSLIALSWTRLRNMSAHWARFSGLVGVALLAWGSWTITSNASFPAYWTLLPVMGAALVIVAGGTQSGFVSRFLATHPMTTLGDLSYSIYLWHWPAIALARIQWPNLPFSTQLAAVLSITPALLSYRYVEKPGRALSSVSRLRLVGIVGVTLCVPIAIAGLVAMTADKYWVPRIQRVFAPASQMHAGYTDGCHLGPDSGRLDPTPCRWHQGSTGVPVYLVGDSNAAQFVEGLVDATANTHQPLRVSTASSCPLLGVRIVGTTPPTWARDCREHVERVLAWLRGEQPGIVFIASSDEYWLEPQYRIVDDTGNDSTTQAAKVHAMGEALTRTVGALREVGHQVVLIQTIPRFSEEFEWNPGDCTLTEATKGCPRSKPLPALLDRSMHVRETVDQVGDASESAVLDLSDEVCPRLECATFRDHIPVYRDGDHITVAMSHVLAPRFASVLRRESRAERVASPGDDSRA